MWRLVGRGADQGKGVAREEAKAFSLCGQEEDSTGEPGKEPQGALGGRLRASSAEPHVRGRRRPAPKCPSF